jgi:PAS domain S-box-containing protein
VAGRPSIEALTERLKALEAENGRLQEAVRALRVEAERFRDFAELLPEVVFEMDEQGVLTFVNRKAYEITGYSAEDLEKGFRALDLFVPEHRERARRSMVRLFQGDEVGMTEYTAQRKDGTPFPILARSAPILREGRVVGLRGFLVDTTGLEQAEKELVESEEKYRQLFLTESDAIVLLYPETGEFIDMNDATLQMYGYTREELLRLRLTDISAEPERTWKTIQEHAARGRGRVSLRYHKKKDGTVFPVEASTSTFSLRGRKVLCGAVRDISDRVRIEEDLRKYRQELERLVETRTAALEKTNRDLRAEIAARKKTEEALRESEERFRTVFDGSLDSIVLIEPDTGVILDANPTAAEAVSMSQEGIVGLTYLDFVPNESKAYAEEVYRRVTRDELSEEPAEIPVRRTDGGCVPFEVLGQMIQINGKPVVLAVLRDITERKRVEAALRESEARYRSLFEESPVALWEADASDVKRRMERLREEGIRDVRNHFERHPETVLECVLNVRVNNANRAFAALVEAGTKEESLTNVSKVIVVDEETMRICSGELAKIAEGRTSSEGEDVTVLTLQGKRKRIFYRWTAAPGCERTFEKVLVSVMDITEYRRMQEELQRIEKLESLGILAGGIAHDFNNILTAISTNLSMARLYGELGEELSQMLEDAEKASIRAQGLTQQLLAFAKGGAPVKTTLSPAKLIRETAEFSLSGSKSRCQYMLPDNLWLVEADPGQIGQVIQNLVINADQSMPRGGTIRIEAENFVVGEKTALPLPKGEYLKVSVLDQGVGIPAKDLTNVFDPFFTTKQRGSGLGLTTSFAILRHHGGHIEVRSQLGQGTAFTFYLPAVGRTLGEREAERRRQIQGEGRILLVDDEGIVRTAAGQALRRIGYEVEFAEDGAQGILRYTEALRKGRPFHAVIMDLTIPGGMGGREAAAGILKIDPDARIVVSSGYANDPVMSDYRSYGFCAVIAKPYRIQELGETLTRVARDVDRQEPPAC